jgi:preprotein translocase subunit SecG
MFYGIILGIHVVVCLALILVVLLQSSKGGGLAGGSAFGGGAEATVFGGRGAATFLSKATTTFGAAFMITSLTLTLLSASRNVAPRSVITEQATQNPLGGAPTQSAPPVPGQPATLPLPNEGAASPEGVTPPPAGDAPSGQAPSTGDAGSGGDSGTSSEESTGG